MENAFLRGWNNQEDRTLRRDQFNMQQAESKMGLLQKIQAQQEQRVVNEILSKGHSLEQVAPELQKTEAGRKVLTQLYAAQKQQMEAGQMGREQAVFSPENIAANTTPGQPAIAPRPTEEVLPEGIAGPPAPATAGQPAIAPQINIDALRQHAAMNGVKGKETHSTHLANEANRKAVAEGTIATRNQTAAIQMMGLQQRAREADQRSQDRALDRQAKI